MLRFVKQLCVIHNGLRPVTAEEEGHLVRGCEVANIELLLCLGVQ